LFRGYGAKLPSSFGGVLSRPAYILQANACQVWYSVHLGPQRAGAPGAGARQRGLLGAGRGPARPSPPGSPRMGGTRLPLTAAAVSAGAASCDAAKLSTQPFGLRQVGSAHRALLVPALTLWVLGRRLSAAQPPARRSATTAEAVRCFGQSVSAAHSRRPGAGNGPRLAPRPVSCYAFVRGWLLLSLPAGRCPPPTFDCQAVWRLSGRSGLSPSRPGTFARPGLPRPHLPPLCQIQGPGYAPGPGPPYLGAGCRPAILRYVSRKTSYHQV